MMFSIFCVMCAFHICDGNRYDFNAFENFELMRAVYKNETICLQTLKRLKSQLETRRKTIDAQLRGLPPSGKSDLIHPVDIYARVKAMSFLKINVLQKWKVTENALRDANAELAEVSD